MMGNKESELTTAIMQYAIRCLSEGDQAALRNMNFGPREVEALREMNLGDMCHIETLRAHCLKIALNREAYWPMVAHMRNRREAGELQKELIRADAAQDMMQHFYGTGSREYVRQITIDPEARDQIYRELMEIFREDVPLTFLFPQIKAFVAHRRLRGLRKTYWGGTLRHMEDLWLEDEEKGPK